MTHWKEIEEKHNKLVKLLVEMGVIDGLNASQLYTEEHIKKTLIPAFRKEEGPSEKKGEKDTGGKE